MWHHNMIPDIPFWEFQTACSFGWKLHQCAQHEGDSIFDLFMGGKKTWRKTIPKKAKRIPWWFSLQFAYKSRDEIVKKTYDGVSAKMQGMKKTLVEGSPLIPAGVETNLWGWLPVEWMQKKNQFNSWWGRNFERHCVGDILYKSFRRKNDNKKYPTLYPIFVVVSQEFPTFLWVFPGSRNLSTGDGGLEGKWKEED